MWSLQGVGGAPTGEIRGPLYLFLGVRILW